MKRIARAALFLLATTLVLSGCAYYNTYYLAKKYYFRATSGAPYLVEGGGQSQSPNFNKAIDYSKKLIAIYPKSKWVDDAYLLWARSLLGREDPLETVNMLRDFTAKYPQSPITPEALFYLGVAHRAARQNAEAASVLNEFMTKSPKHDLVPYAHYERARALRALKRPSEAAEDATVILEQYPKSDLVDPALTLRAEALFDAGAWDRARTDFRAMGQRAHNDDERFNLLLREADAIEAARRYQEELQLLEDAISHTPAPIHADTTGGRAYSAPTGPGADRFGRLLLRIGTVHLLSHRLDDALTAFHRVVEDYPKTALAAEAQYRIGNAYEAEADDFAKAREAYSMVRAQGGSQTYQDQAQRRVEALDRIEKFRSAGGDSLQRHAEVGFLLAEQYLFQLDKPDRALEQYASIADSLKGTSWAAKAMTAQGWVLSHKLSREAEAESLWWRVVREYPATEAQLAARDYLESAGHAVPQELIKFPEAPVAIPDTVALTQPPPVPPLGPGHGGAADSLHFGPGGATGRFAPVDTLHHVPPTPVAPPPPVPPDTTHKAAPADTTHHPAPADTTRRRP